MRFIIGVALAGVKGSTRLFNAIHERLLRLQRRRHRSTADRPDDAGGSVSDGAADVTEVWKNRYESMARAGPCVRRSGRTVIEPGRTSGALREMSSVTSLTRWRTTC